MPNGISHDEEHSYYLKGPINSVLTGHLDIL